MEDNLFNTEEKRASAVILFQSLQEHQGWQLLVQIQKANIAVLRKQLEDGLENETIDKIREIRAKIKIHEDMINTPIKMVSSFTSEVSSEPILDPFEDDIKALRKKA